MRLETPCEFWYQAARWEGVRPLVLRQMLFIRQSIFRHLCEMMPDRMTITEDNPEPCNGIRTIAGEVLRKLKRQTDSE